ncbi:MAG: VCBS repeat-containing protein [Archangiaceae bacterium]|nr:VCBS repeat-containing protein [Archangiaceae bacterium]
MPAADDAAATLSDDTVQDDALAVMPDGAEPDDVGDLPGPEARVWGVMYLTDAQVAEAAALLGLDEERVRTDISANVLAAATLISRDWKAPLAGLEPQSDAALDAALIRFLGLETAPEAGAYAVSALAELLDSGFEAVTDDGETVVLLGANPEAVSVAQQPLAAGAYPPIKWFPSPMHSSGRNGGRVRFVVIHDLELPTVESGVRVLTSRSRAASTTYIVGKWSRSSTRPMIAQLVRESDSAWHAANRYYNANSIGIEHVGYADNPLARSGATYETEYLLSAQLSCAIAKKYRIPIDRKHFIGHGNIPSDGSASPLCSDSRANVGAPGCGGKGHHHDPGRYWNWSKYLGLVAKCVSGKSLDQPVTPPKPPPPASRYATYTGDFDGNGTTDLVTLSPNAKGGWARWFSVELSGPTGLRSTTWGSDTPLHMRNGNPQADYRHLVGDYNGDGKMDVATFSPNAAGGWARWLSVNLSTGSGFQSVLWPSRLTADLRNGGAHRYYAVPGDFDGDGKGDFAVVSLDAAGAWGTNVSVSLSTGSGFATSWWAASTPRDMRNGGSGSVYRVLVGDFNGDGKSDLCTYSADAAGGWASWFALELSTGSGFQSVRWVADAPLHMRNGGSTRHYTALTGDLNGDHLTDVFFVSPDAAGGWARWLAVALSTGSAFTSQVWPSRLPQDMRNGGSTSVYSLLQGDYDGDGLTDLFTASPNAVGAWAKSVQINRSTGSAFTAAFVPSPTPVDMRNGGPTRRYWLYRGRFGDTTRDRILTDSANGGGGWADWFDVDAFTGFTVEHTRWPAALPQHMRNGM